MTNFPRAAFWGSVDLSQFGNIAASVARSGETMAGTVAVDAPGIQVVVRSGAAAVMEVEDGIAVVAGHPCMVSSGAPATNAQINEILSRAEDLKELFSGRYSVVHVDLRKRLARLITDRFGVNPLCYSIEGSRLAFSDRADTVPTLSGATLDLQALFNYAYFHVLPAPRTAFQGVSRLEPARRLLFRGAAAEVESTWVPRFFSAGHRQRAPSKQEFRSLLQAAVEREIGKGQTGAFLSGGTDSSTVAGMLQLSSGASPSVFSIGFGSEGYDEIEYAKIAARHFNCRHFVYYVTPEDVISAVPEIAGQYDQPFGNSSALPAYHCAKLASEHGIRKLLAGDGGDELFGGNTRYAKQKVFAAYERIPVGLRHSLVEPVVLSAPLRSLPGLAKLASYVAQARIPMPDRTETYNLLLRHGIANLFTPSLIEAVRAEEPSELQRSVYAASAGAGLVDRMLAYDWRFTLADNDLPKVVETAALAQVDVGFPLLDDRLVDFSLRLAPSQKVRGLTLRHWFKEALAGFLPAEILRKKKHGFGLPFGPWLVSHPRLQRFARGSIEGLIERRLILPSATDRLFSSELEKFPSYYGEMIWILMMAEQWLRRAAPHCRIG